MFNSLNKIAEAYINMQIDNQSFDEAFNTRANWTVNNTAEDSINYTTKIDGKEVSLDFEWYTRSKLEINFYVDKSASVSGTGSQSQIFGAVINKVIDYVNENAPPLVVFSASTWETDEKYTTRTKLYRTMINKALKKLPNYYLDKVKNLKHEDVFYIKQVSS